MQVVTSIPELRKVVSDWRRQGERVALVPTMGNLHAGHLALVEAARRHADHVVVSIFVNPMQFGKNDDFDAYPRTLEEDQARLSQAGVELLFCPEISAIYPAGVEATTRVEVPGLSDILCGASRPGHFTGVATVVTKLLNMVQPDVALFGEKDFQQLAVIRRMVADLELPVEIVGLPTVREADGLAMSSRNSYLTPEQRTIAPVLYVTLQGIAKRLREGENDFVYLQELALKMLEREGLRGDYVGIRRAEDLREPLPDERELVILAAAWLGRTRLIDNLQVSLVKTA